MLFTPPLSHLHQSARDATALHAARRAGAACSRERMDAPECRDLPAPHWPSLPKLEPTAGGGAYYALGEALRTQPAGIRGAADAAAYSYCLAHQLEPSAAAYVNLGTALWQGGRAEAAKFALNRALRFHPTGTTAAVAYRNLALAAPAAERLAVRAARAARDAGPAVREVLVARHDYLFAGARVHLRRPRGLAPRRLRLA